MPYYAHRLGCLQSLVSSAALAAELAEQSYSFKYVGYDGNTQALIFVNRPATALEAIMGCWPSRCLPFRFADFQCGLSLLG